MKMHRIITALSAITLLVAPASARHWGNVEGWFVTSGDQSCGIYTQKNGLPNGPQSTEFLILKRLDGRLYLQARNPAWNITKGSESDIRYQIDGRTYNGMQKTVTLADSFGKGLLVAVGADFEQEIRNSSALAIVNGSMFIGQVSLKGSTAALATVDSCLQDLRVNGNSSAANAAAPAKPAMPRGDVGRWIGDYPSGALRDRREGTVSFRLTVGYDGRVVGCTITQSSGHQDLDEATCGGLVKRGRFDPAKDNNGKPVSGSYESRVSWKIPS
jgi:TonB family protein